MLDEIIDILAVDVVALRVPGPLHHQDAIARMIFEHCAAATTAEAAFGLAHHAITLAWPARPEGLLPLTFPQFHELVAHRLFDQAVHLALAVDGDTNQIDEIANALHVALLADPDLTGRQPSN
ncbi:hypothetical protein ACFV4P_03120 [Kitasatospora sp. NPDC059795]|uniref:hypothetical protein n=1 Tax=Kitasatospora sp. NPDC059795 TaxID=3346949 RepID=UPI0036561491